jgi:O-antigen/teichoic acid export membrane protein
MTQPSAIRHFALGGAFSSLVTILLVKALGFVESVLVARILGANGFGILALVLSLTNIMIALATLGLPSAVTKFLSGEASSSRQGSRGTLHAALLLIAVSTGIVCLGSGLAGYFLLVPYYGSQGLWRVLIAATVLVAMTAPLIAYANALQGLRKVTHLNLISMVAAVLALPLAVVLATTFGVIGGVIAFLIGSAIPGLLAIRKVYQTIQALPEREIETPVASKTLLNYGLPALLSGLGVLAALYALNSWLAVAAGFAELGNFAIANTLVAVIGFIPSAMGMPLVPLLSALSVSNPKGARTLIPRVMRITSFLLVPVVMIVIIFGPEIIGLTYGPEFADASRLLAILAVSSLIASVTGVVGSQIAGSGKMWLGLQLNLAWVASVVVSSALLIPSFRAIGASLATLIGYAALGALLILVGRRKLLLQFDGVGIPMAWSIASVGLAFTISVLGGDFRQQAGVSVLTLSVLSMCFLLRRDEKQLVGDALAVLGLRQRSA